MVCMAKVKTSEPHVLAINLFKRISQIYGIPVRILLPIDYQPKGHQMRKGVIASYSESFHSVFTDKFKRLQKEDKHLSEEEKAERARIVIAHEMSHAAQDLLSKERFLETLERLGRLKSSEKAHAAMDKYGDEQKKLGQERKKFTEAVAIGSLNPPEDIEFDVAKQRLIGKHGVDALILLYANPITEPLKKQLMDWEKKMIGEGYLRARGGLTPRGIKFIKGIAPRQSVLKKVHFAAQLTTIRTKDAGPLILRERRWLEAADKSINRQFKKKLKSGLRTQKPRRRK